MKIAKREISRGRRSKAEYALWRANEFADYLDSDEKRSFVYHRLAEVSVMTGDSMNARKRFKQAFALIDKKNRMAYAQLLRDSGNFERLEGNRKIGRKKVEHALNLLESIQEPSDRLTKELIVTRGFMARFDLTDKKKRGDAIEMLRVTAALLKGYKRKPQELANLSCLTEALPLTSVERVIHIRRAVELSLRLGNFKRAGEFTTLLGGTLPRSAYNSIAK